MLEYLSPHSPSLISSASSGVRNTNGKLLITLSEKLKRLPRVKGTQFSRGRKYSRASNSVNDLSSEKGAISWQGLLTLLSREWRPGLTHLWPLPELPSEGPDESLETFCLLFLAAFKWLAIQFFKFNPTIFQFKDWSASSYEVTVRRTEEVRSEALREQRDGGHKQSWWEEGSLRRWQRFRDSLKTPILWPPDATSLLTGKDPDAGKNWKQEEKGMTEDEMVGWHHQFNGHDFEQTLGDSEGQGSLACCSPWGRKETDTIEQLNNNWWSSG